MLRSRVRLPVMAALENGAVGLVANRAEHLYERHGDGIELATAAAAVSSSSRPPRMPMGTC